MKRTLSLIAVALWASPLLAADIQPKEALLNAAKALDAKPNYSWKMTVEVPDEPTGTIEGKVEKGGATCLALARGDVTFEAVLKAGQGAVKTEDGWKSLAEAAQSEVGQSGVVRFVAALLQNFKVPAAEVTDLAGKFKDLKEADGVLVGELTEAATKELLLYRTRGRGNLPEMTDAKGSARFWLKDGLVSKYEYKVQGTLSANGNERQVNRTHTIEIQAVGTTKVTVPEAAAKKL